MERDDNSLQREPMYRQWQFSTELPVAVAKGDLDEVQVLVRQFKSCQIPGQAVEEGARRGRLEFLQWMHLHGCSLPVIDADIEIALRENQLELAMWLRDIQLRDDLEPPLTRLLDWACAAAMHGNLSMVRWCWEELKRYNKGVFDLASRTWVIDLGPRALKMAAEGGQAFMLEWLLNNGCRYKMKLEDAAAAGHFMLMKWLLCHYKERCVAGDALLVAARWGNLPMALWLLENVDDAGSCVLESMDAAAGNGHLDMVKWLHTIAPECCTSRSIDVAARGGHLDVVKWLHRNTTAGCTTEAMDGAAERGHLAVVQWLHHNRYEGCTTAAMDLAAGNNHLDVVKWLHAFRPEGCTAKAMDYAATSGHFEMLKWLHENVLERCTHDAMDGAAGAGYLGIVQWLHVNRLGGCTAEAMDVAATNGHLETVKWLHLHRLEGCTTEAMNGAARSGHLEVVQWLHLHRVEGCTTLAMDDATANGHFHVVLFLKRERMEGCSSAAFRSLHINRRDEFLPWLRDHYPTQYVAASRKNTEPRNYKQLIHFY